jgi:O-methyltransferase
MLPSGSAVVKEAQRRATVAAPCTCPYTVNVSHWRSARGSVTELKNRASSNASLLAAASAFWGLYYGQLALVFLRTLRPTPSSLVDAMRLVRLIRMVLPYSSLLPPRLAALSRLSREIDRRSVRGDIVECGVYNGGSAAVLASICTRSPLNRRIWLFDSFEGLPQPTLKDGDKAPEYASWCHGDLSKVREILQKLSIPEARVSIVKGWFQETFPAVQIPEIALLHIDADWYESVKLCLENFYDCVRPGGFIVIDDYGHWQGARKATDEFLSERAPGVNLTRVDYTGRYFQKP